jgi:hypothetical protein
VVVEILILNRNGGVLGVLRDLVKFDDAAVLVSQQLI